jgi:hypothetical protein
MHLNPHVAAYLCSFTWATLPGRQIFEMSSPLSLDMGRRGSGSEPTDLPLMFRLDLHETQKTLTLRLAMAARHQLLADTHHSLQNTGCGCVRAPCVITSSSRIRHHPFARATLFRAVALGLSLVS